MEGEKSKSKTFVRSLRENEGWEMGLVVRGGLSCMCMLAVWGWDTSGILFGVLSFFFFVCSTQGIRRGPALALNQKIKSISNRYIVLSQMKSIFPSIPEYKSIAITFK